MSSARKGGGAGGEGWRCPGYGTACLHWCGNGGSFLFLSEDLLLQRSAEAAILRCRQNEASRGDRVHGKPGENQAVWRSSPINFNGSD
jgi:hypothetical protein